MHDSEVLSIAAPGHAGKRVARASPLEIIGIRRHNRSNRSGHDRPAGLRDQ
jgi:hypothetical protein